MTPITRLRRLAVIAGSIAVCFVAFGLSAAPSMAADVTIENAWVRSAPPGMQMHAGYLTIRNDSDEEKHLVGAECPSYAKAEIHLSKIENGVATMVRQDQVTIPPKGELVMAPGGFHIMLMHPKAPLKDGDQVPIKLSFADGSTVSTVATVQRGPTKMDQGGHGHGGMNMKMN